MDKGKRGVGGAEQDGHRGAELMILGIHHFSLIASSEEVVRFYTTLGFQEERRIERDYDTVVLLRGYDIGLEIFIDPKHPKREGIEPLGLRQLSFRVDDLERTVKALMIEAEPVQTDWNGNRYCVITDPDGNKVQLCEA